MTGRVLVQCPHCENIIRVRVDFPAYNKGFSSRVVVCPLCEKRFLVSDNHIYDEDGRLVEQGNV